MFHPRLYAVPMLQRLAVLVVALFLVLVVPALALAQTAGGTTISAGALFGDVRSTIEAVVLGVIGALVAFVAWVVKRYTGVSIDQKYRDALQSALANGAHAALDRAQVHADTITLDVKSAAVVHLIEYVRLFAPMAVRHFKLDDGALAELARAQILKLLPIEAVNGPPAPGVV